MAAGPLSWSPEGQWVATGASALALDARSDFPRGIRLIDASKGEVRPITSPSAPAYHASPVLSPDGSRIGYATCPRRSYVCHIAVAELSADGRRAGPERRLTRRAV